MWISPHLTIEIYWSPKARPPISALEILPKYLFDRTSSTKHELPYNGGRLDSYLNLNCADIAPRHHQNNNGKTHAHRIAFQHAKTKEGGAGVYNGHSQMSDLTHAPHLRHESLKHLSRQSQFRNARIVAVLVARCRGVHLKRDRNLRFLFVLGLHT